MSNWPQNLVDDDETPDRELRRWWRAAYPNALFPF
jgi:hypothetical protein